MYIKFWSENLKEKDHMGDLWHKRKIRGWESVNWIHLAQNRDH
jgi:hypothetical protein